MNSFASNIKCHLHACCGAPSSHSVLREDEGIVFRSLDDELDDVAEVFHLVKDRYTGHRRG